MLTYVRLIKKSPLMAIRGSLWFIFKKMGMIFYQFLTYSIYGTIDRSEVV